MADLVPPDYTSAVGQIRILINDTVQRVDPANTAAGAQYLFSDAQITAVNGMVVANLGLNTGTSPTPASLSLRFAAADLIDTLANNEAYVAKKIRTESLQTDGPAVANALRIGAEAMRSQAKLELERADLAADMMEIVDYNPSPTQEDYRELGLLGPMPFAGPYFRWT